MPSGSDEVSSFEDQLRQILPGLTGQDLWPAIGFIFLSWGLLVFLPRWKWTPALTLIVPIFHAVIYTTGIIMLNVNSTTSEQPDFSTYEGVVTLFKDPNAVFLGWIHFVIFDSLVGRMVVMDSIQLGASTTFHIFAVIPSLGLVFLLGPMGWLIYMGLRQVFLVPTPSTKSGPTKAKIF